MKDTTVAFLALAIGLGAAILDGTLGAAPWLALVILASVWLYFNMSGE